MDIFIQVFVWIYFLLGGYVVVELLGQRVNLWLTFLGKCQSPKVMHYFTFPLAMCKYWFLHHLTALIFFTLAILVGV